MSGILLVFGTLAATVSVILYFGVFGHVPHIPPTFLLVSMAVGTLAALFGLFLMIRMYREENAPMSWNGDQS